MHTFSISVVKTPCIVVARKHCCSGKISHFPFKTISIMHCFTCGKSWRTCSVSCNVNIHSLTQGDKRLSVFLMITFPISRNHDGLSIHLRMYGTQRHAGKEKMQHDAHYTRLQEIVQLTPIKIKPFDSMKTKPVKRM